MADVMSHHHGGDGDGQDPPRGLSRGPSQCGDDNAPPRRRPRGKANYNSLRIAYANNKKKPLPIKFEDKTQCWNPIGDNGKHVQQAAGMAIDDNVPLYYDEWKQIDEFYKSYIWERMQQYIDYAEHKGSLNWNKIRLGAEHTMAKSYIKRKHRLHREYLKLPEDKKHMAKPPFYDEDDWKKQLEYWASNKFQNKSEANKVNRAKQVSTRRHGSLILSQHRFLAKEKRQDQALDFIELYRATHMKNGEWLRDEERIAYENMVARAEKDQLVSNLVLLVRCPQTRCFTE